MKYFLYKEDGNFDKFLDELEDNNIKNYIKITDELWQYLLLYGEHSFNLNLKEDKIIEITEKDLYFKRFVPMQPKLIPSDVDILKKENEQLKQSIAELSLMVSNLVK